MEVMKIVCQKKKWRQNFIENEILSDPKNSKDENLKKIKWNYLIKMEFGKLKKKTKVREIIWKMGVWRIISKFRGRNNNKEKEKEERHVA